MNKKWTHLMSLWLPSRCHKELGLATRSGRLGSARSPFFDEHASSVPVRLLQEILLLQTPDQLSHCCRPPGGLFHQTLHQRCLWSDHTDSDLWRPQTFKDNSECNIDLLYILKTEFHVVSVCYIYNYKIEITILRQFWTGN